MVSFLLVSRLLGFTVVRFVHHVRRCSTVNFSAWRQLQKLRAIALVYVVDLSWHLAMRRLMRTKG